MERKSSFEKCQEIPVFPTNNIFDNNSQISNELYAEQKNDSFFQAPLVSYSNQKSKNYFQKNSRTIEEKVEKYNFEGQNDKNKINSYRQILIEQEYTCALKELNNLLDILDYEDDMSMENYQTIHNLYPHLNIYKDDEDEQKFFEEKKEDKKFGQYLEKHNIHEIKEEKLQQNSDLSKNTNRNSSTKDSTGDSTPENNPNKSILNSTKYFDHPPANFITYHMKLNMSSCNLYCKLKKKRVREKTIKNRKKSEDM